MTCDEILQQPHYTHPCSEVLQDHARHVILHQYVACLKISNLWVVPSGTDTTWLDLPAVVDVLPGSCLWNPDYGYFRIVSFDKPGQRVLVQRTSRTTAVAGTVIQSCTRFILAPDE